MQLHKKWIAKAEDDLQFAKVGLEDQFYSQVCFLSQQVIEKALKGFLVSKERLYPKTHKLIELKKLCADVLSNLEEFEDSLRIVDEYYIPSRYPDGVPGSLKDGLPDRKNAEEALETVEGILDLVKNKLEQEERKCIL